MFLQARCAPSLLMIPCVRCSIKNMLVSKRLIAKLIAAHQAGTVSVHRESRDFDSWYNKRTAADGKAGFP